MESLPTVAWFCWAAPVEFRESQEPEWLPPMEFHSRVQRLSVGSKVQTPLLS